MDERLKYRMRFTPTHNSPAYKKGEIRRLPLEYSQDAWWELLDEIPDLVIPKESLMDSVFIEGMFVPVDAVDIAPPPDEDKSLYVESEASEVFTSHSGELGDVLTVKVYPETPIDEILYDEMTVKSLRLFIEQRGGEVDSQWRKADLVREARKLEESLRAPFESS